MTDTGLSCDGRTDGRTEAAFRRLNSREEIQNGEWSESRSIEQFDFDCENKTFCFWSGQQLIVHPAGLYYDTFHGRSWFRVVIS